MPQLDKVTFYLQLHISYYLFIFFYLFVVRILLPRVIRAMKLREYIVECCFFHDQTAWGHLYYFKAFQAEIFLVILTHFIKMLTVYLETLQIFFSNELKNEEYEFFLEPYVYTLKKILFLKKY